jgi:hypothetical protein
LLALPLAALALLGCSDDPAPQPVSIAAVTATPDATSTPRSAAQPSGTPTPSPVVTAGDGTTAAAEGISFALPASLPRIDGVVESATQAADGAIAVSWLVAAAPAQVVSALAETVAEQMTLLLDERGGGGGLIVFASDSLAGHYLVTDADGDARVELRLDPPLSGAAAATPAQPLPVGFPSEKVPLFPGATVVSGSAEELTARSTRFVVTFETDRAAVDVVGYYRDLFASIGWTTVVRGLEPDASGGAGVSSLTVIAGATTRGVLLLDWTASSP